MDLAKAMEVVLELAHDAALSAADCGTEALSRAYSREQGALRQVEAFVRDQLSDE